GPWGSGATGPLPAVQGPPAFEDAVDGPHRGERFDLAALEGLVDDVRPVEPQVAVPPQLRSHGQDQVLDGGTGPRGCPCGVWTGVPVRSVEPTPVSVVDPVMDGRLAHVELLGDLVLGAAASDGGDHRLATTSLSISLRLMATSGERCGFSVQSTAERSGSGGTKLIGIRWHMAINIRSTSSRPGGSEAVTRCHPGTFPKTMLGDGRPVWRIPASSGAEPREQSRRGPKSRMFGRLTASGTITRGLV